MGLCAEREPQQRRADRENYQGIRPAPGYPACPEHTEKPQSGSCWKWKNIPV
ncbi:vitamin B12 dependent-methionine synthase activation domain-containing protein [Shigella sonnei]